MNDVTRVNKAGYLKAVEESTDEHPAFEKKVKTALSVCYRKFKNITLYFGPFALNTKIFSIIRGR